MYIDVPYVKDQHEGNQLAVGYTSVSTALATFIAILVYLDQLREPWLEDLPQPTSSHWTLYFAFVFLYNWGERERAPH